MSGGRAYVRGWATGEVARALGRNFGLPQASAAQCVGAVDSGQCRTEPGGDWYDPMGADPQNPLGSLSGPQAARLGVLPANQVETFTDAAEPFRTVLLQPVGSRTGLRALRLTGTGQEVWLGYRAAIGRDAWLGSQTHSPVLQTGVLARVTRTGQPGPLLLDPTPTGTTWSGGVTWEEARQVALPVGQPVEIAGCTVTVQTVSGGQARVQAQHGFGELRAGTQLTAGTAYYSPLPSYRLAQQPDGNLVVSSPDGRVLWHADTWGRPGARTVMQSDGNLVIYASDGRATWWTGTRGNPGARLVMQNDGNLVVYRVNGTPLWWTGMDPAR